MAIRYAEGRAPTRVIGPDLDRVRAALQIPNDWAERHANPKLSADEIIGLLAGMPRRPVGQAKPIQSAPAKQATHTEAAAGWTRAGKMAGALAAGKMHFVPPAAAADNHGWRKVHAKLAKQVGRSAR